MPVSVEDAFARWHWILVRQAACWHGFDEAEDAVSRTWLTAIRIWDRLRCEEKRFSWLRGILHNDWLRFRSSLWRKRRMALSRAGHKVIPAAFDREMLLRDLRCRTLAELAPAHRTVLIRQALSLPVEKSAAWRAGCEARKISSRLSRRV